MIFSELATYPERVHVACILHSMQIVCLACFTHWALLCLFASVTAQPKPQIGLLKSKENTTTDPIPYVTLVLLFFGYVTQLELKFNPSDHYLDQVNPLTIDCFVLVCLSWSTNCWLFCSYFFVLVAIPLLEIASPLLKQSSFPPWLVCRLLVSSCISVGKLFYC